MGELKADRKNYVRLTINPVIFARHIILDDDKRYRFVKEKANQKTENGTIFRFAVSL